MALPAPSSINQKPGILLDSSPSPTHVNQLINHQVLTKTTSGYVLHLAPFLHPTAVVLTQIFIVSCLGLCYRFMSVQQQS